MKKDGFGIWFTSAEVRELKREFRKGTRLMCIKSTDHYHPIDPGEKGTVEEVDAMGLIHVRMDSGRQAAITPLVDDFRIIKD